MVHSTPGGLTYLAGVGAVLAIAVSLAVARTGHAGWVFADAGVAGVALLLLSAYTLLEPKHSALLAAGFATLAAACAVAWPAAPDDGPWRWLLVALGFAALITAVVVAVAGRVRAAQRTAMTAHAGG